MLDGFFFPYERARLWTRNMVLLSLSNFFLYASAYAMLPVLPLWMVQHGYCGYAEAGGIVALFGAAMFLPGVFNSYLIDTFRRKNVCMVALALWVAAGMAYSHADTAGWVAVLRIVQGALFGIVTMATGSTLVIDVTATRRRTDANVAFAWFGRFGMAAGLVLGAYVYPYWDFGYVADASVALAVLALFLVSLVHVTFRAPLYPSAFSLDRFLLPRTFLPGLNMLMVSFVLGIVIAHEYNEWFYGCILAGFLLSVLVVRYGLPHVSCRSEVELAHAALGAGLLLLAFSNSLPSSYIAAVLAGTGIGIAASRFFTVMISLPMHCERGTGNNTYQLLWELGLLGGVFFENVWAERHPGTVYWIAVSVCVLALVMYETVTHKWYYRRMEEKEQ